VLRSLLIDSLMEMVYICMLRNVIYTVATTPLARSSYLLSIDMHSWRVVI
jgi:hypothetical protein